MNSFKEKVNKYKQESKEFIDKWEEKSMNFIHNFIDHFGTSTNMVKDRFHRAISPARNGEETSPGTSTRSSKKSGISLSQYGKLILVFNLILFI